MSFVLAVFAIGGLTPAHALVSLCSQGSVEVEAATADEVDVVCAGAAAALLFLAGEGLDVSASIKLRVVRKLPAGIPASSAGCYVRAERRIYVLMFPEYLKLEAVAEGRVSASDYLGVIAHEVAHAVTERNFRSRQPSLPAQEYVACVTQFAAMRPDEREITLSGFSGSGFEAPSEIGLAGYLFNPGWFCAQAYRHYIKPGNGRIFLHRLLTGVYLLESE